jgi:hypothetical protein
MPETTVSGILPRIGLGRLGPLGLEPALRDGRQRPGELLHIDVKELGPIEGGAGNSTAPGRDDWTFSVSIAPPDVQSIRRGGGYAWDL